VNIFYGSSEASEIAGKHVAKHPNKHIRQAIRYAEDNGWTFIKSGPRSHDFGELYCPHHQRGGCIIRVYSTPKHPEDHARWIQRQVDLCPHHE
jgi:hypothetical protein